MASDKILDAKKEIVSEIKDRISNSSSVIFFDYLGLSVGETMELRKKLKESNSDIKIYKNTLVKRALDNLDLDLGDVMAGPNAMSLSTDVVEPIKIITNYAKEHKALEIKGGIVDGSVSSLEELAKLATIPSREGLLTMLAGGMIGIVKDLSICLHLYSEQKSE
ncbi:MAG: 50S ribosomal protein L10 [Bacilli bacterium]|nr:50S ribosomal protein L10 [Bacilli bacterium]MDD3304678.1 50S ribosomal protein L10 [Bacilli bacterium]MDD4053270.1 50S ribosomal protein L10 [Bacilli bacterium]MDD4411390.1 50S ribosomal protein L10 [Bacilli bacterium]